MTDHTSEGSHILLPSAAEVAFVWFHRLVALYCLMLGLTYWLRLVGFYEGPLYRFDLMPVHWQLASISLAVLYPFAASGLWMIASWGPVIWFLCAAAETVMHAGFPDLFTEQPERLYVHLAVALVYAGFRLAIYLQKRRRA